MSSKRRIFFITPLIVFMLILGVVGSTFAAIAVDGTSTNSSSITSTVSWSHTVGAGSNRLLVVGVSIDARNSNTVSSVTYGAASLTKLRSEGTAASNARTEIWYLLAPASGSGTITVTIGGTATGTLNMAGAVSYTGVDQTTPFSSNNGAAGANATTPYVSVSSATGNLVFDVFATYRPTTTPSQGAGQTLYWKNTTKGNTGTNGGMSSKPGSAAASMTWSGRATTGTGNVWSISAASIKAAAGAPPVDTTPPTVSSTTPANGATGVLLNSSVTINWSENIDCATVNTTNIRSTSPGWTLSSCSTNKAVFATSGQANSTAYTVTATTAVKDTAGNAMAANYAFSYTTEVYVACIDADLDGYGTNGASSCTNGTAIDCNDNDPTVYPGAPRLCDGKDNDCDGRLDFSTDVDQDNDGILWCAGDCNDLDPAINPSTVWYKDSDNDGYSDGTTKTQCLTPQGYKLASQLVATSGDCNDTDPAVNPGFPEFCGDRKDNNCNGQIDEQPCICPDLDNDGFTASYCGGADCNDNDPNIHPGAVEICTDGIDNNCNGLIDRKDPTAVNCPVCTDVDGDGFAIEGGACGAIDCNDNDSTMYPGAPRICDGKDNDCDGRLDFSTDIDADHDGYPICVMTGQQYGDCNDNNPNVNPGVKEGRYGDPTCSDGIDNDCDGKIDAQDPGCFAPVCGTKTNPKDGPHMFDLLNSADNLTIKTSCEWCHQDALGNDVMKMACQRCHADPADTSDPLNGILKQQYPANPPYGFGTAINVKLHSSSVVGTKYGSWDLGCMTCHNPMQEEQNLAYGTTYGKYVKEYLCYDNTVTGINTRDFVKFTSATGAGSFADGQPYNENVCETCHTQTNHHRRDGAAPGDLDGNGNYTGHHDGELCTTCHAHSSGFKPVGCGGCHEVPPPTGTHLKHFSGSASTAAYGSTGITKDYTGQGPDYIMNCGNCHPIDMGNHQNRVKNAGGGDAEIELYNPNAPAGSLKALNPPSAYYTPGSTVYTDSKGLTYTQGTCNNVYCHSGPAFATTGEVPYPILGRYPDYYPLTYTPAWEGLVVESRQYVNPTWGAGSLGCNGCHGYPITTQYPTVSAGAGDSHAWVDEYGYINLHMYNMGFGPMQCNTCHYNTVRDDYTWGGNSWDSTFYLTTDISIFDKAQHVNGAKNIAFTPVPVTYTGYYGGTTYKDLTTATFDAPAKTCSNVACHLNETVVKWGAPYRWWNSNECNSCHRM